MPVVDERQSGGNGGSSEPLTTTTQSFLTEPVSLWTGTIDFSNADIFVAVGAAVDVVPADAEWVIFNLGGEVANQPPVGTSHWIPISQFDGLVVDTAGSAPGSDSQVTLSDFYRATATGTTARRDIAISWTTSRQLLMSSDASSEDLINAQVWTVKGVEAVTSVTGAADPSDATGGSGFGLIEPKADYDVDDVGKFIIENRLLKRIELYHQDGHAKMVGGMATPGTWHLLGDEDEGGGAGAHFRGFHTRSRQISGEVADDFYASRTYGDFEIYSTTPNRWDAYNPFEENSYWDSFTPVGGTAIDIDQNFQVVDTREEAFDTITAAGQAFVVLTTREVIVAASYVAPAAEHTEYRAVLYIPPGIESGGSAGRTKVYYRESATERLGALTDLDSTYTSGYARLAFNTAADEDLFDGGEIEDFFVAAASVSADIDARGGTAADGQVFELPVGFWSVQLAALTSSTSNAAGGMLLMRVASGADEIVAAAEQSWSSDTDAAGTTLDSTFFLNAVDVDVTDGDQFYALHYEPDAANGHDLSYYLHIEERTAASGEGASPGGGGQASEGGAAGGAGGALLRLYQAEAAGTTPGDPPDPWSSADGFETDFGDWTTDPPALGSDEVLWVANGGTLLDDNGDRQNRAWQVYITLAEQYSVSIQDLNSYTLDSTADGIRFVRSILTTGPGVWDRIEDGTDGWIVVVDDEEAYANALLPTQVNEIVGGFDAEWFREIEVEVYTFGGFTGGNPSNLGVKSPWTYRRADGRNWTEGYDSAVNEMELGVFKMRLYDENGLNGVVVLEDSASVELGPGLGPPSAGNPPRRIAFRFKLIGQNAANPNNLTHIIIGPYSGVNHYARMTVRMR